MRELSAPVRLGAFTAGLAVLFVGALGVGAATGDQSAPAAAPVAAPHGGDDEHGSEEQGASTAPAVTGTSLSADGLRLDVPRTTLAAGVVTPFSFRVLGEDGAALTEFEVEQDREMHLVVVDRDLRRFAHLHPERAADGTWSTPLTLAPGSYRAVADFQVEGERRSLAVDLVAPGPVTAQALPAPATTASVDGLDVRLDRDGERLAFTVTRDGAPVALEDYLGAQGHLVAFRAGDLAYAHVHPVAGTTFEAELPTAGTYRLFLQVQVDSPDGPVVRTAPFTLEVTS